MPSLPDAHSDFPFSVSVESWWPPVALGVVVVVVALGYRRLRKRRTPVVLFENGLALIQSLSPLELKCIELVAQHHWTNFRIDGLRVKHRETTGVGRYVYLEDALNQRLSDGEYGPEPGRTIQMAGLEHGLDFVVAATSGRIDYLELVTASNAGWDGEERDWRVT